VFTGVSGEIILVCLIYTHVLPQTHKAAIDLLDGILATKKFIGCCLVDVKMDFSRGFQK